MTDANDPESTDSCSLTEEEVEPKLKYVRLSNDLKNILSEEAISCIAVHSRFLCLGTHWGRIHMLDHQGNRVETLINLRQNPHILSVNKISVDSKGEYIGTCSDDGMAIINGLYTDENNQKLNVGKVIRAVELDPLHYKSGSGRRFLIGDHKLVLYERTFLKGLKSTVLSESEGAVSAIKWNGQFIAWASSLGVHVYDLSERCSLGLIKWEEPKEGKLTDFRCNLSWSNSTTLLIGWVDTIRICVIRKRNPIEVSTRNLPAHIVDPMSTFQTEFYVCGVAPLESHQLVVLGYPKDRDSETNKALRPILCVLQYKASDYIEICTDSLSMRGYQEYKCDDYHLDCLIEENQYFIVSPKDVVVASLYETDDRVQWLIEHGCEQWVEFCCCAQTAETFYTGGVFALKSSYLICGDHFEAGAFLSPPARSLLVPGAVPRLKPGRTLPTAPPEPAEFGFVEEEAVEMVVVKQEDEEVGAPEPTEIVRVVEVAEEEEVVVKEEVQQEEQMQVLEATQFPDEVLVEMLDPEQIKEEMLPEFEEVEPVIMEELPSNECEIIEIEEEIEIIKRPQHQSDCIFATGKLSNFEERYKRQIRQNKNTESQIKLEKLSYSQMAEKCRKANDLLAAKIRKKQQLQRKLKEYKRIGPEALLRSMESFNAKSCNEGSDSSVDEAKAWW